MAEVDEFLAHYGVPGMKWGRRNGSSTPRKTEKEASRDAKESAKAKMYYGEGAGVRRRLINNTVKSKSKDPVYKEAFERNLAGQDMAKAASQARTKRKRTDTVNSAKKTTRGVSHMLRGNTRYASASAALLVGGAMYAHKTGIDKRIADKGKTLLNDARVRKGAKDLMDQIRNFKG